MIFYEDFYVSLCKISCSKAVLESCMSGTRKNLRETAKLFNISKSLKLFGINKVPHFLRKLNETMNIVINFTCLVKVLISHFLSSI